MDFVRNPRLTSINPEWPGNPREGGRYLPYAQPIDVGFGKVVEYFSNPNPQAAEKRADRFAPALRDDDIQRPGNWVCWLGHASFLIQLDGVRYLTDPCWHRLGLLPRRVPAPYTPQRIDPIDYLLLSHNHRDHVDSRTIRELSERLEFVVLAPLDLQRTIRPWLHGQPAQEAGWYQRFDTPATEPRVTFMPTQHWTRRYLHDTNRSLWGSFVLAGKTKTVYFGADSAASPHFAEVRTYFPDIDLAMLGIGAYKPAGFMQGAHTSPQQAWTGFEATGAKRLVPMHYGTYDLSQEPAGEPARLIREAAVASGRGGDLVLPAVGEVIEF